MSDTLKAASDLLSEQARKFDIAMYYTHSDSEKAKQMVAGTYKDLYAVKARFSSSSVYGAFLFFFNNIYNSVASAYVIVSNNFAVDDLKTNVDWRIFEKDIERFVGENDHDEVLRNQLKDAICSFFSMQIGAGEQGARELSKLIQMEDPISVNRLMHRFVQTRVGFQNVNVSVDYEPVSSVDMETLSISSSKISENELNKLKEDKTEPEEPIVPDETDEALKGKEIKLMMNGALILSPIKGKDIGLLTSGDRIKISIVDRSNKAITVLKAFNAYNEGNAQPITGRIVTIKHKSTGGYKVVAVVAKGIYVKIDEEEESIKVALDPAHAAGSQQSQQPEPSGVSVPLIVVLIIVFIALISLIVAFVID
jgi:RPA family protein